MSTTTLNITPTTMIINHNNEQYTEGILNSNEKRNVNDGRQNQRDREKGERENREDDVKRRLMIKERTRQTNKKIDSVISFTNEQYKRPIVNTSMANSFSSSFNSNINYQNRYFRNYEPSYPSINRYYRSPYRTKHYLDDSDEEIIKEEILEIINFDHYPTLIERWGEDTKPIIKQEGEFKIEDYVEFEEIEPTITEEITYEITYSNGQIKSTREIYHTRSESRNFRKIKKRRTKRKRTTQLINEIHNSSYHNDLSGDYTYGILPSIIKRTRPPNSDLINENRTLQTFTSDEQDEIKQGYENNIQEEINQSHVSSNDIISRIESSINQVNDTQTKIIEKESQLPSAISEVDQEEIIDTPIQSTLVKDELTSHFIPDSFDKNEQSSNEEITINKQQDSPDESSQFTIKSEELTPSIDHSSPKTIEEQISVNSLIELLRQIRTIPLITHLPSVDTHSFKQETTSEDLPIDIQLTKDSTVQYTPEDEKQFNLNIISTITESEHKLFDDNEQRSIEETTVPSEDSPATLPLAETNTDTGYSANQTDEKSISNLTDEINKQPETISIQSKTTITPEQELTQQIYNSKNESIISNSATETAETIISSEQQPSSPLKIKEDENVELSSDFLADIIRQIITTTSTTRLPSVHHTEQLVEKSTKDSLTDITEQTNITSILTTTIEDNELLKSSEIISTIKTVQETISGETEIIPLPIQSITPANESTSSITDINAQTNSTSSIQNDVSNQSESLYQTDQNSILDTYDNLQQSSKINPESSYSIFELTNIMNNILTLPTKTLSEEMQSETIEQISSTNFFIPETLTTSETDFRDVYQDRYIPFTTIEQTLSNFTPLDNEQLDEKQITPDLTKIYYELQEQRHIQPVLDEKQEISNVNLNNHIEHFDIKSFSSMSNLPSKEYRQVFGVPDEIVNTVNDLTYYVDQKLQSIVSNEKPQIIEVSEDNQPIISTDQEELINEITPSITSNAELDLRYTSLLDRINTLIKPLGDLSSSSFITENKSILSNIKEDKNSSNVIDYTTSVVTNVISNITPNLLLKNTNEETTISSDTDASDRKDVQSQVSMTSTAESTKLNDEILTPTVTDGEIIASKSSEEISTKVKDDEQEQSSSTDLTEIMKHLLSSPSTSSEEQTPTIDKHQETVDSSNIADYAAAIVTTVISSFTNAIPTSESTKEATCSVNTDSLVEEQIPFQVTKSIEEATSTTESTISDIEAPSPIVTNDAIVISSPSEEMKTKDADNQQQEHSIEDQHIEVSKTPLQSSTTNEEEHHGVFDLIINTLSNVKETIINLGSSDEKTPLNISDKSTDDSQQSKDLDNDKQQQTIIETAQEIINNTYEKIVPTQEQVIQIPKQPIQSSIIDHKQQDESEKKLPYQQLQVINDDYPWYSSYYNIIDAEAKFARLYKQLNLSSEQSPSPTIIESQKESQEKITTQNYELQDEQDNDKDSFLLLQRRKRIPSSTTHDKTVSSTIITSTSTISPDIDLQPIILHGHPNVSIPVSSIIPQTTDTTSKKKHKKKKKDKKEIILFNAPEPTSSDINKQKIDAIQSQTEEEQGQENIEMNDSVFIDQPLKHEVEQLHPIPTMIFDDQKFETLSTSIIFDTEELKQIDDKTNESISSDTSQLLSTPVTPLPEDVKVNAQLIEQQPTDKEPIPQSSPSTTKTILTKSIDLPKDDEEEDNEGFQLVSYHKRILSTAKSDQTPPSTPTSKEILSPDIDQKTPVILGHQSLPTSTTAITESSTSKKKRNKHKKHKKEIDSSSIIDSKKIEQESVDQETILQSHVSSSSIIEDSNVQSNSILPPTIDATPIRTKPTAPPKEEEEEEDNEGFQVVSYRKRITSASRFANTPPSSSTRTKYEQNISRNIAHRPVVLHGRHGSASPSTLRTTVVTKTSSNQNKQVRPKQDKKQTSLSSIPPRSVSAETHIITSTGTDNSFQTSKNIKQKTEQPQRTLNEYQQRLKDSKREPVLDVKSKEQSTKQIVKEHPVSTKDETSTADQQSSIEEIVPSTTLSASNIDIEKPTLIEDDNDGFQVVHYHKHIPSSPASTISKQSSLTYTIDQKSTDTSTKNDSSLPTTTPEIVIPQTTTPKKKSKKPKITKDDTLPSLTTNIDSIPLSVEETIDRKTKDDTQQVPEPQIIPENNSSNSDKTKLINTTYETMTSQITEPVYQTDDAQSQLHSIKSAASSTTAIEEISIPSNEHPDKIDDLLTAQSDRSTDISQTSSTGIPSTTNQIEKEVIIKEIVPTINTEDEHVKTTPSKKAAKQRKKQSHTKEKPDDEHVLTSSASAVAAPSLTSTNIESNIQQTDDIKQESNWTTTQSFNSPSNTSEILSEEINDKLDIFLPEYIRQQMNTNSSIPTSSDIIQKKKPRSKMLNKDHEAKSLLTNEFDNTINTKKQDDECIAPTSHSKEQSTNISPEQTIDNILSRGFYLWLQESQAISQQKDNLTNIMQSIVIQPEVTNDDDEDEDSCNASKVIKSTYMTGIRPKKRIHITNAYSINHPECISKPSWLIAQSNENTFEDKPEKFDSDNEEDSLNDDTSKKQTNSNNNNNNHQQTNFTKDDVQQCLSENFYHQIDNNPSINFDDWAYFLERKNSYHIGHDLSTSLECFYTETFDEDTLLSDTIPIHHSIKNQRQRYGDFLSSNNDESIIKLPLCKSKPSEYFQNWQKQESNSISYQNDDEIFISHSNDGLSRRVRP